LNLPSLDLAGMERATSAAIRLRDTGQWKAQFYGYAKILQHDKSIPKITYILANPLNIVTHPLRP